VAPAEIAAGRRSGILAQRKDRPNGVGISRCQLLTVNGLDLRVRGLDAIAGNRVLDIKPRMTEFDRRSPVHQPAWAHELRRNYG
jgi:tRNA (Thr-GGU) A37 N-methylase